MVLFFLIFIETVHTKVKGDQFNNDNCAVGWVYNDSNCYKFNSITDTGFNWSYSIVSCQSFGGDLLSIADETENVFIEGQIKDIILKRESFWIGLNDFQTEGNFSWSDNTKLTFTKWAYNQPNNNNNQDCVATSSSSWNDRSCENTFGFICKINLNVSTVCNNEWLQKIVYKDNCYIFYSVNDTFQGLNWNDSRSLCSSFGGNLLSVANNSENEIILQKIYTYVNNLKQYWIGFNDIKTQNNFICSDNTISHFTHWNNGKPDKQTNKDCVLTTPDGWNNDFCYSLHGFICKFKKELNSTYIFETQDYNCSHESTASNIQKFIFPMFFKIVKGLNGKMSTVSFKTLSSNSYLRHQDYYLKTQDYDASMNDDASFILYEDKYFKNFTSIQSSNYPGYFITYCGGYLKIEMETNITDNFQARSSFKISTQWTEWSNMCTKIYQTKFKPDMNGLIVCRNQDISTNLRTWTRCSTLCGNEVITRTKEYCNIPDYKYYSNHINTVSCLKYDLCGDSSFVFNNMVLQGASITSTLNVFYEEFEVAFNLYIAKIMNVADILVLQTFSDMFYNIIEIDFSYTSLMMKSDGLVFDSNLNSSIPTTLPRNAWSSIKVMQYYFNSYYYRNISINGTVIFSVKNICPKVFFNVTLVFYLYAEIMDFRITSKTQVFWSAWSVWSTCNAFCVKTRTRNCTHNQWLNCTGKSVEKESCENLFQETSAMTPFLSTLVATTSTSTYKLTTPSQSLLAYISVIDLTPTILEYSSATTEETTATLAYKPTTSLLSPSSSSFAGASVLIPTFLDISSTVIKEWSSWSECSVTCGEGNQTSHSLNMLKNDAVRFKGCNIIHCPVDGMWSNWTISECSKTCGGGNIMFIRSCDNPPPSFSGRNCIGTSYYTKDCPNDFICPVNGNWSEWKEWSLCNQPCNGGVITRYRECSNPNPKYGGTSCVGNSTQTAACLLKSCKTVDLNLVVSFPDEVYEYPDLTSAFIEFKGKIKNAISNLYKTSEMFDIVIHSMKVVV